MLSQGRIISARVIDPQGNNPKVRPLVIISSTEEIEASEDFTCVVISGTFPDAIPEDHVLLPFSTSGPRAKTGLTKPSSAICTWLEIIRKDEVLDERGHCPTGHLIEIMAKVDLLK